MSLLHVVIEFLEVILLVGIVWMLRRVPNVIGPNPREMARRSEVEELRERILGE